MRTVAQQMGEQWYALLRDTIHSPAMLQLGEKLRTAHNITPCWDQVFRAYELTPSDKLKVLVLGQDPYPKPGQAMGLAFSSGNGVLPYSLENIFKDLQLCDYDHRMRKRVDLTDWAEQGVMLLNTCLTTEVGKPFSHKGWGWEVLIRATLYIINSISQPYVVFAWGKPAQELINSTITQTDKHLVLKAAHPANERYARGSYIGSKHFQTADAFFKQQGIEPIKWI